MSRKVFLQSLGCDKNLVDAEMMLGLLTERGYELTDDENAADAIIVNTCCFIGDAKEESIRTLIDLGSLKGSGNLKVLIATGCLAQRYASEIRTELPEVDAVVGTAEFDGIADVLDEAFKGKEKDSVGAPERLICGKRRILSTGGHYAYLKIAEGCDKCCTYCIIPKLRGHYRSVPMETLVEEARLLAEGGVRELILVAQETTLYGTDLYGKKSLPELLKKLCEIRDLAWIRILYCYPEEITEELIDTIAEEPKICHYLDLPIQHSEDGILKRMGRKTDRKSLERTLGLLRERIPDIVLRTTLITGFPGETAEDIEGLEGFVRETGFERLGVFPYSAEEGTAAERMEGQIPQEEKERRRDVIMELQQSISADFGEKQVGRILPCIVEGRLADEEEPVLVCRSYMDAPDVDGYVFVRTDADLMSGTMVNVRITESTEYDLLGELT